MIRKIAIWLAWMTIGIPVAAQQIDTVGVKQGTLGVVATAHLDTQWRWTIRNTIDEMIPATLRDNFKLLDLYPGYVFSFEGAFRYMLAKEYYPEEFERLRAYIRDNRWRVTGSWVDAVDVNMPSFESLVRHALYGNGYFKREFGKTSRDIFLPDCFGFGYALPSIAAHCGLKSFSTQKLSWGSAEGVPFDIGLWEGVDGSNIIAGIRPGDYVARIQGDLTCDTLWMSRANEQREISGLHAAYMYFGTGDQGGAPESTSVAWLQRSIESNGPLQVKSIGADDLTDMVAANPDAHLPHYKGELLMTRHGVGCYTSQSAMKRWNRRNEQLADAAERASAFADFLYRTPYPREQLRDTWVRFLWHQFHDDLTGTSIPEAYEFSWNDEVLCLNRFSGILEHAVATTASLLDTRREGIPLVIYNPLAREREDIVEATIKFEGVASDVVAVQTADFDLVPGQVVGVAGDSATVLFSARVPPVGYSVYGVRFLKPRGLTGGPIHVDTSSMENEHYRITLNSQGQITSIFHKELNRELLSAPLVLELLYNKPRQWPAWEIQYEDLLKGAQAVVGGDAQIRVLEKGPVRGAIEVIQHHGSSIFRTVIRLASGDAGKRIEFVTDIDWQEKELLLKAAFRFTSPNDSVTYDLGLGAIERGLNTEKKYEVPGHQWADMTAEDGTFGVAVLNDSRYGWDHPDPGTLRLSLVHTPGVFDSWRWVGDQQSQDIGHHQLTYAIMAHSGDWRVGEVPHQAARLNQPLVAFQTTAHEGMGEELSLLEMADPQVFVNAVKVAEESDEIVVRVRELYGSPVVDAPLRFTWPIESAREINGAEEPIGDAVVKGRSLVISLAPYQPKAFAVKLKSPGPGLTITGTPLTLPYNLDGISTNDSFTDGDLDGHGNTLARELLPREMTYLGVPYSFGPSEPGAANVVRCEGQAVTIPSGSYNRFYILAAAVDGPAEGTFMIDGKPVAVWVQDYAEPLGQWNNRLVSGRLVEDPGLISPAYINRQPVAWYGSHRHTPEGNDAYRFTYAFLVSFDLPEGAKQVTLPNNPRIRVFAASAVNDPHNRVVPAAPLYDEENTAMIRAEAEDFAFVDGTTIKLSTPVPTVEIRYTTDGSDPNGSSPLYAGPVAMHETGVLKARGFMGGAADDYITQIPVTRLVPKEPVSVVSVAPGLRCRYYEGEWSKLPDFDTLTAINEATLEQIAIPPFARAEDWGVTFNGYVRIPADGLYDFSISSDDGSLLWVSDSLVVDNDGLHGEGEVAGQIALKAGLHKIRAHMFNCKGGRALSVLWRGPGFKKQILGRENLFAEPATDRQ